MDQGWIKLHRILLEDALWQCLNPEHKVVMITLLLMVNHEENEWIWKGEKFKVQPGQKITSIKSIKENCQHISDQNIRSALSLLKKFGFLTSEPTNKGRLITICNWSKYQENNSITNKETNKQLTSNQQATNKQLTTNKNNKNEKNEKNEKKKKRVSNDTLCEKNLNIKIFIDYFYDKFLKITGEKYLVQGGKDGETIKRLLQTYSIEELKELCDRYFISKDSFVLQAGFSIGIFSSVINKLISGGKDNILGDKASKTYQAGLNLIKKGLI